MVSSDPKSEFVWEPLQRLLNQVYYTTTLDKTCWRNSWKSSKFKKWLNCSNSSVVAKSLKICQQHWFAARGILSLKNRFSILSHQFLSKIVWYWYFLKKPSPIAQWYWNACSCTVCFKFNQFQVIKVILMN